MSRIRYIALVIMLLAFVSLGSVPNTGVAQPTQATTRGQDSSDICCLMGLSCCVPTPSQ